jgi:hypothetical protein
MRSSSLRAYFNRELATSFDKATVLQLILSLRISSRFPTICRDERVQSGPPSDRTHDHKFCSISLEVRVDAIQTGSQH